VSRGAEDTKKCSGQEERCCLGGWSPIFINSSSERRGGGDKLVMRDTIDGINAVGIGIVVPSTDGPEKVKALIA